MTAGNATANPDPVPTNTEGGYTGDGIVITSGTFSTSSAKTFTAGQTLNMPAKSIATVWAPVNCGYDATKYKYGKLYQWGRAVGGGYSDNNYTDAGGVYQITETTASVSTTTPNTNPTDNVFYLGVHNIYDWYIHNEDASKHLQSWPMKSGDAGYVEGKIANPCPAGWRVPTYDESIALVGGAKKEFSGGLQTDTRSGSPTYNMSGLFFDGTSTPKPTNGVFLPSSGQRNSGTGGFSNRGSYGYYWSSSDKGDRAWFLGYNKSKALMSSTGRACDYPVRCVKE